LSHRPPPEDAQAASESSTAASKANFEIDMVSTLWLTGCAGS
jgi:hypothetical protein